MASGRTQLGRTSHPTPWRKNMMNRIRTRIESKRANNQLQSYYMWRPAPGRR
jgi:hypothetical protein